MEVTRFTYTPKGVCCKMMDISIASDGTIDSVTFKGGCHGNLQGISSLVRGMRPEDAISKLKGIDCGGRGTSCPDQFALALEGIK